MFVQQGCYLQNISEYAIKRYLDFATFPLAEEKDLMMVVTEELSILALDFLINQSTRPNFNVPPQSDVLDE